MSPDWKILYHQLTCQLPNQKCDQIGLHARNTQNLYILVKHNDNFSKELVNTEVMSIEMRQTNLQDITLTLQDTKHLI